MARKIVVFFLLLLAGTWMAWGENGPARRTVGEVEASEGEAPASQLPSVMRRSANRSTRTAPPPSDSGDFQPASASEEPQRSLPLLPPSSAVLPAAAPAPTTAPPPATGAPEASTLPTVLRRKPKSTPASAPAESGVESAPSAADQDAPAVRPDGNMPRPFGPPANRANPSRERAAPGTANNVLLQGNTPGLRVETSGPRTVRRGTNARYLIHVTNTGDIAFQDVEIRVSLPNSVALSANEASSGESRRVEENDESGLIVWTIPRVEARGREQLTLQLVPHNDRAFELGIDWVCRSPRQVATIEVQQPQLELSMSGPKDARYGEALNYLVTVSNPGSGDAEGVSVKLTAGTNAPESVAVGVIGAGQQKQIEVQLAANQPGELKLIAEATGEGDLRAEAFAEVLVRRAELQANVTGPKTKFAGVPSLYQVQVANAGNAPADDVTVQVMLPPGARVDSATEGARQTANSVVWKVGSLAAEAERVFEVRCELTTTGENKVEARVNSADGLTANSHLVTTVEALADLKLTVQEPKGPRQVGDEITYELVIGNRGTKAAEEINVVMQFAEGIEPLGAEGAPAEIVDGQVVFEPLARLAAGQQVTLRIRARAEKAGGQRFRAEVQCSASDTQLVSEGTTRVFGDDAQPNARQATTNAAPNPTNKPTRR